jgi:predicted ATPase
LYSDGLLEFSLEDQEWKIDFEKCSHLPHTFNVVEMLLDEMQKLNESTLTVLKTAACIGFSFDVHTLEAILDSGSDVHAALTQGLQYGYIQPDRGEFLGNLTFESTTQSDESNSSSYHSASGAYQFLHDRVHEGFYQFVKTEDKPALHLHIGKLLLQQFTTLSSKINTNDLFRIIQHLNIGSSLITCFDELFNLAQLNVQASTQVLMGGGYSKAIHYANTALDYLKRISDNYWNDHYQVSITLHTNLALALGFSGEAEQARQVYIHACEHAKGRDELAVLLKDRAGLEVVTQNFEKACEILLQALALYVIKFEVSCETYRGLRAKLYEKLQGKTFLELFPTIPVSSEKSLRVIYLLLLYMIPASFCSRNITLCTLIPVVSLLHRYDEILMTFFDPAN